MLDTDLLRRLGNAMRKARKEHGFTQRRLSEASGITERCISKVELGEMNPSFITISRLLSTMGATSFDALFNPSDEQLTSELQEIEGIYRSCSGNGRRLILATIRALGNELSTSEASDDGKPKAP